jgi:23S rRNA (cytosine1962-C5)-methyltransferase
MSHLPAVKLKKNRASSLYRKHPWIFSGAIYSEVSKLKNGDLVQVTDEYNEALAIGHFFHGSIAVRVLEFSNETDVLAIFKRKIYAAYALRKQMGLVNNPNTNIYRLIHGEGDGLSGLIIDIYGGTAVIQCHSVGMYSHIQDIAMILVAIYGNSLAVFDKSEDVIKEANLKSYIIGSKKEELLYENGIKFIIDWEEGQKTGFFIDQRNNRKALQKYVKDKNIINLFSYSGGFSMYAQEAGASQVISVDASRAANEICIKNFELNFGISHEAITADAVEYLKSMSHNFDVIVLDPPAFAKHLSAKHKAIQGYKKINVQAIKHIKPNGILLTFSCSQVIDAQTFKDTITAAGIEAGRNVRIIEHLSQPEDHPINLFHPESNYLKGLVLFVE